MRLPKLLTHLFSAVARYHHADTLTPVSDIEHLWRVAALASATEWARINKVAFTWQRSCHFCRDAETPCRLWRCHVSIRGRHIACLDEVDFGADDGPGQDNNEVWAQAEAALKAMVNLVWDQNGEFTYVD